MEQASDFLIYCFVVLRAFIIGNQIRKMLLESPRNLYQVLILDLDFNRDRNNDS